MNEIVVNLKNKKISVELDSFLNIVALNNAPAYQLGEVLEYYPEIDPEVKRSLISGVARQVYNTAIANNFDHKNVLYLGQMNKNNYFAMYGESGIAIYVLENENFMQYLVSQYDFDDILNRTPYTREEITELLKNLVSSAIKITYDDLKELRDTSKLIIGQKYRIIDYETTTIQESTKSAGHPFDVIVTAISENQFDENARICIRDGDTYFGAWDEEVEIVTGEFVDGIEPENIEVYFTAMVDKFGDNFKEYEGLKGGSDIIVELDYKENNLGVVVPIFYKNDVGYVESGEESTDYQDTFYYCGTEEIDGETYDKWIKIEDSGQFGWTTESKIYAYTNNVVNKQITKGIVHHKEHSLDNIEIKYCLDNDTDRFSWIPNEYMIYTDDSCWFKMDGEIEIEGTKYYKWKNNAYFNEGEWLLSETLELNVGDSLHHYYSPDDLFEEDYSTLENTTNAGKGVIYYMKDEWGNQCPYDFKNILFLANLGGRDEDWFYTFTYDDYENILDGTMQEFTDDEGMVKNFINNIIGNNFESNYENNKVMLYIPGQNIFYTDFETKNDFFIENNILGNNCRGNIFQNHCHNNKLEENCQNNNFGIGCNNIKLGVQSNGNDFGSYCEHISTGSYFISNHFINGGLGLTFGNRCNYNWFHNGVVNSSFGNEVSANDFYQSVENSSFGNNCNHNMFYGDIENSSFGNNLSENKLNKIYASSIGNDCRNNINSSLPSDIDCFYVASIGNGFEQNEFITVFHSSIGDSCWGNNFWRINWSSIGNEFRGNKMMFFEYSSIENYFCSNKFNASVENCSFGNRIYDNDFYGAMNNVSFGNYIYSNEFHNVVQSSFGNCIVNNIINGSLEGVSFGNAFYGNKIEARIEYSSFGNRIIYNTFESTFTHSQFGNGIGYIHIVDSLDEDYGDGDVRVNVQDGVSGVTNNNLLYIDISSGASSNVQVQLEKDSKGQILMYWNDDKVKKAGYYKESNIADEWLELPVETGEGGLTASVSNGTLKLSSKNL